MRLTTYRATGGFIGHDYLVYISSVLSHAPGIFSLVVTESVVVATAVDLVAGQSATMAATAAHCICRTAARGDELWLTVQAPRRSEATPTYTIKSDEC